MAMKGLGIDVFDTDTNDNADSEVLNLFRDHTVVQVRDIKLELSNKIEITHQKFTTELQERYRDILKVTDEVGELYNLLKYGDSLFMNLCFKDELYRVNKLPEIAYDSNFGKQKQSSSSLLFSASAEFSSAKDVLLVSNWDLAVTDFISRFTTSTNPGKLFDNLFKEFENLKGRTANLGVYKDIIESKSRDFLSFIIKDETCRSIFTVNQGIKLYNLVLRDAESGFEWDSQLLKDLDSLLFETILVKYTDAMLKDDLVKEFVSSKNFQAKFNENILKDIRLQFTQLDHRLNIEEESADIPVHIDSLNSGNKTVPEMVEEARLYSMGLVTTRRIAVYQVVTPLIEMLDDLKCHGGDPEQISDLKGDLIARLQQCIPPTPELLEETIVSSTEGTISEMIQRHNNEIYIKLVEAQIKELRINN